MQPKSVVVYYPSLESKIIEDEPRFVIINIRGRSAYRGPLLKLRCVYFNAAVLFFNSNSFLHSCGNLSVQLAFDKGMGMNAQFVRFAAIFLFCLFSVAAVASDACKDIKLSDLKKEVDDCIIKKPELSRSQCIVRSFTCADTQTSSSGFGNTVKFLWFEIHKDRFFVSQNRFHYRQIIFDEPPPIEDKDRNTPIKEYQVGFGYQFMVKQKDSDESITGTVESISEQLAQGRAATMSFVGIIGIDPISSNGIYDELSLDNSNTTPEGYLSAYSKIDSSFSKLYSDLVNKAEDPKNVAICPQLINSRFSSESASFDQINRTTTDIPYLKKQLSDLKVEVQRKKVSLTNSPKDINEANSKVTALESQLKVIAPDEKTVLGYASQIEIALCEKKDTVSWPSGIFIYTFSHQNGSSSGAINGSSEKDKVEVKYARRRFFGVRDARDIHAEYYAEGDKSSLGGGSLFSAVLSISGTSEDISNSGFAFGYSACLEAMPANASSKISKTTLPQLQGFSQLTDSFNSSMKQINNWAKEGQFKYKCQEDKSTKPAGSASQ